MVPQYLHSEGGEPEVGVAIVEQDTCEVRIKVGGGAEALATAEGVEVFPQLLPTCGVSVSGDATSSLSMT